MSPEVVAEQVNALPVVRPVVGQDTVLVNAEPATVTEVEPLCVTALVSLAALLIE